MSDITQYFEDLRRDIKSHPKVASVKIGEAERTHTKFESRTYRVFLKQAHQDNADAVRKDLATSLQVEASLADGSENYHILISDAYDAET